MTADAEFDLDGLDPASARLVGFILRLVGGDLAVRGEVEGTGEAVDAVTVALNMMAESFERESVARARAEELLADAVDTYDRSADALCSLEVPSLAIAKCNATLARILGLELGELTGRSLLDFVVPSSRVGARQAFTRLAETGAVNSFDVELAAQAGTMVVSVTGAVKRGADDRPVRLLLTLRDETGARALAEKLVQGQRLDALGRLAGGIAHDFNNLLTVILASSEMLARRLADRPRELVEVQMVRETADRAASLVRDLLAFARQESSTIGRVVIDDLVSGSASLLRRLAGSDIELEVLGGAPWAATMASHTHLDQALVNLVVNARDAMPDGGRIAISTRARSISSEEPALAGGDPIEPGEYVELVVEDSGPGMPTEVQARIFEPFFTTKPVGQGTGLGLSIVYGVVRQARGHVHVESAPGEGTRFTLLFPQVGVGARTAPAAPTPAPASEAALLVVDDDDLVRPLIARVLREAGYHVIEASSGEAALASVQASPSPFDLVVSDVMMPGMDGLALLRSLRELRAELPCLFVTGYAQEPEQLSAMARIDVLNKPFVPATLLARVRQLLCDQREPSS